MARITSIYFSHGGVHAAYMYIGVLRMLHRNVHRIDVANLCVYGCSAGAFFALLLMLVLHSHISIDEIEGIMASIPLHKRDFPVDFTPIVIGVLETLFRHILRNVDIIALVNRRLNVGVSLEREFRFVRRYKTNAELCHTLMLSMNLPVLSSYNRQYIDGGIRFRLEYLPKDTFVVYNLTYFPASCIYPGKRQTRQLVEYGISFTRDYLNHKRSSYDQNMHVNEFNYGETTIAVFFAIHRYMVTENPEWVTRVERLDDVHVKNDGKPKTRASRVVLV